MTQQMMEPTLSQNDIQAIASTPNHNLTSRNSKRTLALSDKRVNELAPNKFVNSVSNSSEVHISNTSNNIYNAPVVINNIYRQCDNTEQLASQLTAKQTTVVPENPFLKRFCSIFRGKVQQLSPTKFYITIPVLLSLIIVLIVGLMVWLLNSKNSQTVVDLGSLSNTTPELSDLRIVSRTEWSAKSPKAKADLLTNRPSPLVIIHHTATTLCYFRDQCIILVRSIQNDHMYNRTWNDIGYNFLVGGDGFIYEGRGWNAVGSHTLGYNFWSIGIGLIGTFVKEDPTVVQLTATQQLIQYGVKNGYISVGYKLLGHRQCRNSTDPGDALYSIIKTWDHWSSKCQLI